MRQACLLKFVLLVSVVCPEITWGIGQKLLDRLSNRSGNWEFVAISFANKTEKECSSILNELANKGWQYVGPLGNSMVAFQKRRVPKPFNKAAIPGTTLHCSGMDLLEKQFEIQNAWVDQSRNRIIWELKTKVSTNAVQKGYSPLSVKLLDRNGNVVNPGGIPVRLRFSNQKKGGFQTPPTWKQGTVVYAHVQDVTPQRLRQAVKLVVVKPLR